MCIRDSLCIGSIVCLPWHAQDERVRIYAVVDALTSTATLYLNGAKVEGGDVLCTVANNNSFCIQRFTAWFRKRGPCWDLVILCVAVGRSHRFSYLSQRAMKHLWLRKETYLAVHVGMIAPTPAFMPPPIESIQVWPGLPSSWRYIQVINPRAHQMLDTEAIADIFLLFLDLRWVLTHARQ